MRRFLTVAIILGALAAPGLASAEDDLTSLSYISYLERYATVQSVSQTDATEAVINMPLIPGDRLDTAREGRVEVQLADGSTLWLDEYTSISFDAVAFSRGDAAERTVLFLGDGTAMLEIPDTALISKPSRVDTANSTAYLSRPGLYRLEALRDGGLRIEVWMGHAEVATPEGGQPLEAGSAAEVSGSAIQRTETVLTNDDAFAQWVEARRQPAGGGGDNDLHVDARYARQEAVLDSYGGWIYVDDLGTYAWQPTVSAGWTPYTYGRWGWTPTGWCWISYEPWGWMPYHYGSWYFSVGVGWVWSWGSCWGPAWVDWAWWPGYVGWCPMGYYDHWYWNRYPGYHPGYPSTPGYPSPHPDPRLRVPGPANGVARPGARPPLTPDRFALGFTGHARLRDVDPTGWNVVRTDDFTNPHLPRMVTPGRDVFPRLSPDVRGVVRSGPLMTAPPSARSIGDVIRRPFRTVSNGTSRDLTPILARDPSLSPDRAGQLVRATTPTALVRASRERSGLDADVVASGDESLTGRGRAATPSSRTWSTGGLGTLPAGRNLYRPTIRHIGGVSVAPVRSVRSAVPRPSTADPRRGAAVPSRSGTATAPSTPRTSRPAARSNPSARQPIELGGGSFRTPASRREPASQPGWGTRSETRSPSSTTRRPAASTGSRPSSRPSYGGFLRPPSSSSSTPRVTRPSSRTSTRRSTRIPTRSSTRSYSRPSSRSYSRPSTRSYSRPSSRSFSRPSSRSYSRPSTHSYSRPSSHSFSRPSHHSYSRPSSRSFSRPSYHSSSRSTSHGHSWSHR